MFEPFPKEAGRFAIEFPQMSRDERWKAVHAMQDRATGQPAGTSAREVPSMARFLANKADVPPWIRVLAHFILQDFKQAEALVLKESEATQVPKTRSACWMLAAHVAREEKKLDLAWDRFKKAEKILDQAGIADPKQYLFLWVDLQEGLLQTARIKQDSESCLALLRGMHAAVSKQHGPLSGTTLGYHNRYANELYLQRHFADAEKEFIALLKAVDARPEKDAMQVQVLRDNLAKAIASQGRKEEAQQIDLRLVQKRPDMDKETEASLDRRTQMGLAFYEQKKYQEAAEQFRIAYDGYLIRRGPDQATTISTKNDLAVALQAMGKNEESAQLLIEIISAKEKKVPEDDVKLLENRNNLGNALAGMSAHARAAEQHRTVAEIRARVLGPRNAKTLDAMGNLAGDLQMLKQFEEAIDLAQKVVAGRTQVFGPLDAKTIHSRGVFLLVLSAAGKHDEAAQEARSLVVICEKELGPRALMTLSSYRLLATVLFNGGRMEESRKWCRTALKGFQETVGPHNRDTILCEELLANLNLTPEDGSGKDRTDNDPSRVVLISKLNALGPNHIEVLKARTALGHSLQQQEKFAEAEKEYETAISGLQKKAMLQTESGINARIGLAEVLRHTRRLAEAESLTHQILDDCVSNLPEDHYFRASVLTNFGLLLNALGRHEEALAAQKEALMRSASTMREGHPSNIKAHFQISNTLWRLNRADESRAYLEKAYELSRKTAGEQAPETRMYKHYLQNTSAYDQMIKYHAAEIARGPTAPVPHFPSANGGESPLNSGPPSMRSAILNPDGAPNALPQSNIFEDLRKRWENP